jgi:hypothetical protein
MPQQLKTRSLSWGSSGHRLFISALMIASKVICDDTYSNQSWVIVAQKMFALQEMNQMEREMCAYLEWKLNFQGDEVVEFEAIRSEHGSKAIAASWPSPEPTPVLSVNAYSRLGEEGRSKSDLNRFKRSPHPTRCGRSRSCTFKYPFPPHLSPQDTIFTVLCSIPSHPTSPRPSHPSPHRQCQTTARPRRPPL